MTAVQVFVIILCAAVIGLALYLLIRSLRKMARGSCCEGCTGCRHASSCSSRDPAVDEQGVKNDPK